jgi:hypothetical protein
MKPPAPPTRHPAPRSTPAVPDRDDGSGNCEATPAVSLLFGVGEMAATAQALAAARAAGMSILDTMLRHLGGDWGDVDHRGATANDDAVLAGGPLRSVFPLRTGDAVVVTTDAERGGTVAALASQTRPCP